MTREQEDAFFSKWKWTEQQRRLLVDFNEQYDREKDISSHPLITPARR
jgi:hypothetical protein